MPLLPVKAIPALQSTKPWTCALLKCAKAVDTSCFQDENRSWQVTGVLLADEVDVHFLIIADSPVLAFSFPQKTYT
jgi:hypothetical protein